MWKKECNIYIIYIYTINKIVNKRMTLANIVRFKYGLAHEISILENLRVNEIAPDKRFSP